jgi:hypothetical protein
MTVYKVPTLKKSKAKKKANQASTYLQNRNQPFVLMGKQPSQLKFQTSSSNSGKSSAYAYQCVLNDPFNCIPVRLGGECQMPTGTATLTSRGVYTPASGTAFSLVLYPWAQAGFMASLSTAVGGPYTYSVGATGLPQGYPTGAALQVVANGARIIAAGVRIASLASATNDSGVFTIGCLPRETVNGTSASLTDGGFPFTGTTTATQGYNEFLNYLQTESYPAKMGASAFYRPQDPLDYTFRNQPIININTPAANSELTPFFVIGASGLVAGQSYIIEQILHVEYTVSDSITGLINTDMGDMSIQDQVSAPRLLFEGKTDTSKSGVEGGFKRLLGYVDKGVRIANKVSNFSSTVLNALAA